MKLTKRDFAFFVLGSFVFLLGSRFAPFQAQRLEAQSPFQEWIRCGRLEILDEVGAPLIVLDAQGGGGGIVNIFGKGGWASLSANKNGGEAVIAGESGEGRLTVDENGVQFSVKGDGESETRLSADEHGGVVSILNKTAQEVGQFRVSENGVGVLRTLDKQGNETGSVR